METQEAQTATTAGSKTPRKQRPSRRLRKTDVEMTPALETEIIRHREVLRETLPDSVIERGAATWCSHGHSTR